MRYCGSCGAPLDSRALIAGRCPFCRAAITPTGDTLAPTYSPDPLAITTGVPDHTTLPGTPQGSLLALPTTPAQWPQARGARTTGTSRGAAPLMLIAGVFLLMCALLLICADFAIVASMQ